MEAVAQVKLCLGPYSKPIYEGLLAEARQPAPRKAVIDVRLNEDCVEVIVRASGVNDLRAILNSYLYLIHAAYSALAT